MIISADSVGRRRIPWIQSSKWMWFFCGGGGGGVGRITNLFFLCGLDLGLNSFVRSIRCLLIR
jgi:hypothetical protein